MLKAPTVYVMGGYAPHGGTRMAYEIGLTAHSSLGLDTKVVVVNGETPEASVFDYSQLLETETLDALPGVIQPHDLLICNPSFSDGFLGLRYDCKKLMYVQGFNTFPLLDRWFDRHVAVSGFVRDYLKSVYGLDAPIIPPFIDPPPYGPAWEMRPADSIVIYLKGNVRPIFARLRSIVEAMSPNVASKIAWEQSVCQAGELRQAELRNLLANTQRLLCLSVAEGFGLVPLEAMSSGVTVIGFDGFGGRDYVRPGVNCAMRPYPDIDGVARDLVASFEDLDWGKSLAVHAPAVASSYNVEHFRTAWRPLLEEVLTS